MQDSVWNIVHVNGVTTLRITAHSKEQTENVLKGYLFAIGISLVIFVYMCYMYGLPPESIREFVYFIIAALASLGIRIMYLLSP